MRPLTGVATRAYATDPTTTEHACSLLSCARRRALVSPGRQLEGELGIRHWGPGAGRRLRRALALALPQQRERLVPRDDDEPADGVLLRDGVPPLPRDRPR